VLHVPAAVTVQSARMSEFDDIVERLKNALAEARKRVSTLEGLLRALEQAKISLPLDIFDTTLESIKPNLSGLRTQSEPQRVRGELPPREVAAIARNALLETGKPLKRGQLVRELEKRGVPLAGADKNKNLGTILWRHRAMFVSLPKLGYWAKGVPLEGVYDPDTYSDRPLGDGE